MFRFIMGLATGYLTMTTNGQELTKKVSNELKKDITDYLKKEGVIEQPKTTRHTEPSKSDVKSEEQCIPDEPILE